MLQNLREHAQGWIAGVIATILCLAFALWGIQYYLGNSGNNDVAAKVNGETVTLSQWNASYQQLRRSLNIPSEQVNSNVVNQLKKQSLQQVITQAVLAQAAATEHYRISDAQIGDIIGQIPAFQVNGKFSPELYHRLVYELFHNEADFINTVRQEALIMQAKTGIVISDFALANEVDRLSVLADQTRDFNYLIIPANRYKTTATISNADIQNYYQQHQADFMTDEEISLDYVVLAADEMSKKVNVTEDELQQYYNDNLMAFSPKAQPKTFAEARPAVEKALRQQKLQQLLDDASDQLSNLTFTNPDSLQPAAVALSIPVQTSGWFSKKTASGIVANPKILNAAFSDNVLKQRNNSDLISLDNKTLAVIRVHDYKPSQPKPLAEVRPQIMEQLTQSAAENLAKTEGVKIVTALQQGQSAQQLAQQNNLTLTAKNNVSRKSAEVPTEVLNLAFSLSPAAKIAVDGKALANGDYAVVIVSKVTNQAPTTDAVKRQEIASHIATQAGEFDYSLYSNQKMKQAKIKYPKTANLPE